MSPSGTSDRLRLLLTVLLVLLFPTGCKVGPDYARPEVPTAEQWRWKVGEPRDQVPKGEWWRVFQEPELDELQIRAAAGNLDLQAAFARVEQARANARMTRSDLYPTLDGSASFTRYRTSGNAPSPVPFPIPSFTQEQWTVPLDLSYEIDLWGKVRRGFESSRLQAAGVEAARLTLQLSLEAEVAIAYFLLKSYDRQIVLLEAAVQLRRDAAEIFEQRRAAGIGADFELQRSLAELASAEAELQAVHRLRGELLNALAVLCGVPPSKFDPAIPAEASRLPMVAADLPSSLLERRPDIAEAERELASRNAQIGVAKAAFFPVVRLTASGGYLSGELSDLFDWESRVWTLGPSVSLPIFQGGRNKANLERARAAYDEGVALYRQRILVAFQEVEDSLVALQFLEKESDARTRAAEASRQAARLSLARYQAGTVDFLGIVDSENLRLLNEQLEIRVQTDQLLATVRLIKALGGGWESEP